MTADVAHEIGETLFALVALGIFGAALLMIVKKIE